jgi:hypothetical protein
MAASSLLLRVISVALGAKSLHQHTILVIAIPGCTVIFQPKVELQL